MGVSGGAACVAGSEVDKRELDKRMTVGWSPDSLVSCRRLWWGLPAAGGRGGSCRMERGWGAWPSWASLLKVPRLKLAVFPKDAKEVEDLCGGKESCGRWLCWRGRGGGGSCTTLTRWSSSTVPWNGGGPDRKVSGCRPSSENPWLPEKGAAPPCSCTTLKKEVGPPEDEGWSGAKCGGTVGVKCARGGAWDSW